MSLDEYRKLAGLTNLRENKEWRLTEALEVGASVRASADAGADSNKKGTVLSFDGDWVQIRTNENERLWLPRSKLQTEAHDADAGEARARADVDANDGGLKTD